jgi:uncharacterized repeat protein (TIGR03833 family)
VLDPDQPDHVPRLLYQSQYCTPEMITGNRRELIKPGLRVTIVLKADQATGRLTEGVVQQILTRSATHPHGIKVRLESGAVGRVKQILE